jgi:hypothetical protein
LHIYDLLLCSTTITITTITVAPPIETSAYWFLRIGRIVMVLLGNNCVFRHYCVCQCCHFLFFFFFFSLYCCCYGCFFSCCSCSCSSGNGYCTSVHEPTPEWPRYLPPSLPAGKDVRKDAGRLAPPRQHCLRLRRTRTRIRPLALALALSHHHSHRLHLRVLPLPLRRQPLAQTGFCSSQHATGTGFQTPPYQPAATATAAAAAAAVSLGLIPIIGIEETIVGTTRITHSAHTTHTGLPALLFLFFSGEGGGRAVARITTPITHAAITQATIHILPPPHQLFHTRLHL